MRQPFRALSCDRAIYATFSPIEEHLRLCGTVNLSFNISFALNHAARSCLIFFSLITMIMSLMMTFGGHLQRVQPFRMLFGNVFKHRLKQIMKQSHSLISLLLVAHIKPQPNTWEIARSYSKQAFLAK